VSARDAYMTNVRALAVLLGLGATVGIGGVVPRYTLGDLTARSETIVEGRVTHAWTAWDSKHIYIWTHYEVQTGEVLKGSPAAEITVSEPGGTIDGVRQLFSGAVPYGIGEHVVLFLYRTPIGYLRTRGGPQGKFSIRSDAALAALKASIQELTKREAH
jgi:hypothetical protein